MSELTHTAKAIIEEASSIEVAANLGLPSNKRNARRIVLGRHEWVGLPDLGIPSIKAKVDTGARTSAIHAFELQTEEREDGLWVRFSVHPDQGSEARVIVCQAPVADQRVVRDSGGHEEPRYVIETALQLGGVEWPIEVTLTSRDNMGFRMLLGRTAIRRRFVVDSARSYLIGKKPHHEGQ